MTFPYHGGLVAGTGTKRGVIMAKIRRPVTATSAPSRAAARAMPGAQAPRAAADENDAVLKQAHDAARPWGGWLRGGWPGAGWSGLAGSGGAGAVTVGPGAAGSGAGRTRCRARPPAAPVTSRPPRPGRGSRPASSARARRWAGQGRGSWGTRSPPRTPRSRWRSSPAPRRRRASPAAPGTGPPTCGPVDGLHGAAERRRHLQQVGHAVDAGGAVGARGVEQGGVEERRVTLAERQLDVLASKYSRTRAAERPGSRAGTSGSAAGTSSGRSRQACPCARPRPAG